MANVESAVAIAVLLGVGYSALQWFRSDAEGLNSELFGRSE